VERELACIGHLQLRHESVISTVLTPPRIPYQPTLFAEITLKLVRGDHKALNEEGGAAVADEAVALHLAQPEPPVLAPALGRVQQRVASVFVCLYQQLRQRQYLCSCTSQPGA